jgi:hypothetical protein
VAIGQVILFAPHLPLVRGNPWLANLPAGPSLALFMFAIALTIARLGSNWASKNSAPESLDRLWLDFRDSFGLLWGLRMQERVNAASSAAKWEVELHWNGFQSKGVPPKHSVALRQSMTGLLRFCIA